MKAFHPRRVQPCLLLFVILGFGIVAAAQASDWPSVSYLRNDLRESAVAAHVWVSDAKVVHKIGGYEDWQLTGTVKEAFKGPVRRGSKLTFYIAADSGLTRDKFLRGRIVFLKRNYVEMEHRRVYAAIENSTLPYSRARVRRLRSIVRPALGKR
jgi:hypothetical protein